MVDLQTFKKGYNFFVLINGMPMSFVKVSGLQKNVELQPVSEGGYNSGVHYLRNASGGEKLLTLNYGMSNFNSLLTKLTPGRYLPDGVQIGLMNDSHIPGTIYSLEECYVKKIEFGELDAQSSKLIVNTLEISYSHMNTVI